jgi:ADP-ribosylglycohydrolase
MSIEKAQAMLLGLALGDALGWPTEFMNLRAIKQLYGPQGIDEPPDPARYTDDTQMTVALAEGLLDAGPGAPLDVLMEAIGGRFLAWKDSPENNRAPGGTVMWALGHYENGTHWRESGKLDSKGCGSAMRVAPIGYLYRQDESRLREVAEASSLITHRHPAAVAASIAGAYLAGLALEEVPPGEYLRRVMLFCDGVSEDFDAAILRVGHVLGWVDEEAALRHIGEGWIGEEAIALALYCVLRYPDDYVACVRRAANTDGDSDSIASIAGGIMGARLGLDAIPADWIDRCENRDYLFALGQRLGTA